MLPRMYCGGWESLLILFARSDRPIPDSKMERLGNVARNLLLAAAAICLLLPTAAVAQVRSLPTLSSTEAYRFGPGDIMDVQIWGNPDLSGPATVDPLGRVRLPLVGEVNAGGISPEELSKDLTERFQLLDPSVSEVIVSVSQYISRSIAVVGEVRDPDVYGFHKIPDLWSVILTAGGPTAAAEMARVQVVRAAPEEDQARIVTVDLSRGLESTPLGSLPVLRPGDKVLVPSSEDSPTGGDRFQIIGAVADPGVYRTTVAKDIVEALAVAGGPVSQANLGKVYLTRTTATGVVSYRLDLEEYLFEGVSLSNMTLLPGDTIMVPERSSFWSSLSSGLRVLAPFASLVVTVILATN